MQNDNHADRGIIRSGFAEVVASDPLRFVRRRPSHQSGAEQDIAPVEGSTRSEFVKVVVSDPQRFARVSPSQQTGAE